MPLPDPVTLAPPTLIPARARPRMMPATVVVLPAFIPEPTTTIVPSDGSHGTGSGRAKSSVDSCRPVSSTSAATTSSSVGGFWEPLTEATVPIRPPAVRRWVCGRLGT